MKEQNFLEADKLKEQVKLLKEKINRLSEKAVAVAIITDDIREEKNDPETMVKCLSILYIAMQAESVRVLTPTLRSLMFVVLNSLDVSIYYFFTFSFFFFCY